MFLEIIGKEVFGLLIVGINGIVFLVLIVFSVLWFFIRVIFLGESLIG